MNEWMHACRSNVHIVANCIDITGIANLKLYKFLNSEKLTTFVSIDPFVFMLQDQPLREIMAKYSQSCGTPLDKIKFMFDGDVINPNDTPEDLDMDEEGVIDVVICSWH